MKPGRFITLEGGEGAGKTSNMEAIVEFLKARHKHVVVTREPGGTELGEKIRLLLLERSHFPVFKESELLLIFAARSQHIQELILPALEQGKWVVCDRFVDASYAYQGGGRQICEEKISVLVDMFANQLLPDLTFLLDMPVEVGLSRARQRSVPDRFESEELKFFLRVRDSYLARARQDSGRIKLIDASRTIDLVQAEIGYHLKKLIAT